MSEPSLFPLGAVLTVTSGSVDRPLCSLGDLYSVLGFLRRDVPGADELQTAIDECRPLVLDQHPGLADVVAPPADTADVVVLAWLADREAQFGAVLELASPGVSA